MSVLQNLRIKFSTDISGLQRGLKTASRAIAGVSSVIAVAKAGMNVAMFKASQMSAEFGKQARQAGVTMSQWQAISAAAAAALVPAEQVLDAIADLEEKTGEALREPTSEAAEAFKALGINLKAFGELDAGQKLGVLFDQLNKIEDLAMRSVLANMLIPQYKDIRTLAEQGSKAFEKWNAQLAKYGLQVDESVIGKSEMMKKEWEGIKSAFEAFFMILSADFAPAVEGIFDKIASGLQAILKVIRQTASVIMHSVNALGEAFSALINLDFDKLKNVFTGDQGIVRRLTGAAKRAGRRHEEDVARRRQSNTFGDTVGATKDPNQAIAEKKQAEALEERLKQAERHHQAHLREIQEQNAWVRNVLGVVQ